MCQSHWWSGVLWSGIHLYLKFESKKGFYKLDPISNVSYFKLSSQLSKDSPPLTSVFLMDLGIYPRLFQYASLCMSILRLIICQLHLGSVGRKVGGYNSVSRACNTAAKEDFFSRPFCFVLCVRTGLIMPCVGCRSGGQFNWPIEFC